jgi:hypothetical protein
LQLSKPAILLSLFDSPGEKLQNELLNHIRTGDDFLEGNEKALTFLLANAPSSILRFSL